MINVAAIRMQQFGVQFYQASLTASDIDKLVRFEVLNYGDGAQAPVRGGKQKAGAAPSKVNWDFLERRIASSDKAYQRQIIRRKIDELVQYYEQCRQARDLPSIPGAVIISCDEKLSFQPADGDSRVGILKVPEREGILRAIDGQHRLLALHADIERLSGRGLHRAGHHLRPAAGRSRRADVRDDQREAHAAERVAPGQPVGPAALPRRESLATAHDVVRALNDREDSPLYDEIKLLGVGRGRVAQAPLAQELKKLFAADGVFASRRGDDLHEEAKKFFVNYFKQIALVFGGAWNGRKYSIRSASALRAFIRVAPDVIRRLDQEHADRADFRAIGRVIAPWGRRIGDLRFETEGAWKRAGTTVDSLAKELRLALMYPEGAAV